MTPRTRPVDDGRPSRRTVLRLAAGAVTSGALAGCSLNNPLTSEKTPAAQATRDLAPDVAVAVEAVTLVRGAQAAATSTGEHHSALAPKLTGLLAAHQAHLEALVDAVPEGVDTSAPGAAYVVPARPRVALTRLTEAEQALHDGLVALAVRAQSGAFARLLGAMAAAMSQQLRVLAG